MIELLNGLKDVGLLVPVDQEYTVLYHPEHTRSHDDSDQAATTDGDSSLGERPTDRESIELEEVWVDTNP